MPEERISDWVEFQTIKDLLSYIISRSNPQQQFHTVLRFKELTYTYITTGSSIMLFFTREKPHGSLYLWQNEKLDIIPAVKPDRSMLNIVIMMVSHDSMIEKLFYQKVSD
jgi:subtilase family serine protease